MRNDVSAVKLFVGGGRCSDASRYANGSCAEAQ